MLQTKEELYLNRKEQITSQVPILWDAHDSHALIAVPPQKSQSKICSVIRQTVFVFVKKIYICIYTCTNRQDFRTL